MTNNVVAVGLRIDGDATGARKAAADTANDLTALAEDAAKVKILDAAVASVERFDLAVQASQAKLRAMQETLSDAYAAGADASMISKLEKDLAAVERQAQQAEGALRQAQSTVVDLNLQFSEAGISASNLAAKKAELILRSHAMAQAAQEEADYQRHLATETERAAKAAAQLAADTKFEAQRQAAIEYQRAAEYADWWAESIDRVEQAQHDLSAAIDLDKQRQVNVQMQKAAEYADWWAKELDQVDRAANALDGAFRNLGVKPLKDVRLETEKLQAALATIKASGIVGSDQERSVAAFKERLNELRREVGSMPPAATAASDSLGSFKEHTESLGTALGSVAQKALMLTGVLATFDRVGSVAGDIVKTGAAFETLEARLSSLLGSSDATRDAIGELKQLAITTPFEVEALADSFTKLTAFGLQPSISQMRSLADTAATLGGGTESLAGVTLALGQAWAKGKLQGDEVLQLAERGIPVWDVLAKTTGKTTAELQKMSEAGELGRGTILKLIDALGKANTGASEKLMATFSGTVSNAKDALAEFYDMVAKAGVLDFLTTQVQDLLVEFDRMKKTGELSAAAKRLADDFIAVGEGVRSAVEAINALSGVIKMSVEVWAAWKLAGMSLIPVLSNVSRQAAIAAAETTSLATASESAAVGAGRLAGAIRLLKGLTLVGLIEGVISMGSEFLRAKKAAEDGDRAIKKMLEPIVVNGPHDAIKAIVTETETARFSLTEYQRALGEMLAQGKSTGDALAEMIKKADFSTVSGVGSLLNGLESIRSGAQATGEQIREALQDRLNKMSGEDLRAFGAQAESAFNRGEISALQLGSVLNGTVDGALKQLGSSTQTFAGGLTSSFIEAAQQVGIVENSFSRLKDSGQDAGAILKEAFGGALNLAKSIKDFEALEIAIKASGEAGRLSKSEVSEFLDKIREKVDALKPGVNSLAEAFKTLGMKTPEDLKKTAEAAQAAFEKIKNSSDYSAIGINNTREAFKRYAEAAIAANGGVASETLRAQASIQGLNIALDASGKAMVQTANYSPRAAQGFNEIGDAAEKNRGPIDLYVASLQRAAELEARRGAGQVGALDTAVPEFGSSENSKSVLDDPNVRNRKAKVDMTQYLYQRGGSIEEVKRASKYIGEFYARNQMSMETGNLGTSENAARMATRAMNDAADKALEAARQEIKTGQPVDIGTSVSDIVAQKMALIDHSKDFSGWAGAQRQTAAMKAAGNEANAQPIKTIKIDLGTGAHDRVSLFAEDEDSANRFLDLMERKAKVSSKR